jgi:hypothetical protein
MRDALYGPRRSSDKDVMPPTIEPWHAALFWLVLLVVTHEVAWVGRHSSRGSEVWGEVAWGMVPALAIVAICGLVRGSSWPVAAHHRGYAVYGSLPVIALLVVGSVTAASSATAIGARSLRAVAEPLDLTAVLMLLALAVWFNRIARNDAALSGAVSPQLVRGPPRRRSRSCGSTQ